MREISTNPIEYGEHILIDGVEYVVEEADGCDMCSFYLSDDSRKCGSIPCNAYGKIFRKVKKKPQYRPYKDTDEMIADYKERFNVSNVPAFCLPLIWVKDKSSIIESTLLITEYCEKVVRTGDSINNFRGLFDNYTYLDGSPCGKEIE